MRLRSSIWVGAYLRRCSVENLPAVVVKRGAEEAGAIFVKVNHLDGTVTVLGPAPMSAFDEEQPAERLFSLCMDGAPVSEAEADGFLERQRKFDSDLWVLEVESREGRHLIDTVMD